MKILIVDDEQCCRDILQEILEILGHEVSVFCDPKQALADFRHEAVIDVPFQMVFTDFQMPCWSGVTLAMHLNSCSTAHNIKVPIVCVTAVPYDVDTMNKRDGNPIKHIVGKPYLMQDIQNAITFCMMAEA